MQAGNHYTIFRKDGLLYGVPIEHVREVVHGAVLNPAPVPAEGFLGLFDFRQILCPVFDIRGLAGTGPAAQGESGPLKLIVLECDRVVFALWIDQYVDSVRLDDGQAPESGADEPFVDRVFRHAGGSLSRLNLANLAGRVHGLVGRLLPAGGLAAAYARALAAYQAGDFVQAGRLFTRSAALEEEPTSLNPSLLMVKRCRHLAANPPAAWDGAWTLAAK